MDECSPVSSACDLPRPFSVAGNVDVEVAAVGGEDWDRECTATPAN